MEPWIYNKKIDKNTFLQYYENLWNTTYTNLNYNRIYLGTSITSDETENALEWMQNGKNLEGDKINSESYKHAPEVLKLRLLQSFKKKTEMNGEMLL